MKCIKCGKEMINTTGGNYTCPKCNMSVNDLVYRPQNCDMPMPQGLGKQGWICPICGRGVSPWVDICPCQRIENVAHGTSTGIKGFADVDECMKWVKEHKDKITEELK